MTVSVGLVVSVIAVILAIAALEVGVLLWWRRRRRRVVAADPSDAAAIRGSAAQLPGARAGENALMVSPSPRRNPLPILAVVFTSIGLLLGSVAGISAAVVAGSVSGDRQADGTVVDLSYGGKSYDPVVEFTAPSGATIRFTSGIGSNPPAWRVGEHVGVLYDPGNPQDATIDQYWQIWFFPTLFGIIGTPFLLIGIAFGVVTLAARRRQRVEGAESSGSGHRP
jgi:Protein of unknown function (DUF3592)